MGSRQARPQLRATLFLAHGIATGCNAGLVAVSGIPLHINLPQWMAFRGHTLSQLRWTLHEREDVRHAQVHAELEAQMAASREVVGERSVNRLFGEEPE